MNFDELYHKGRLPINDIYNYVMGNLSDEKREQIELAIKDSKEDFDTYVDLKEALYLLNYPQKIEKQTKSKVFDMITKSSLSNYIHYKIRTFQEKIFISSSDQVDLVFSGIVADFAVRGSKPGVISVSRNIDGEDVRLVLTPIPDKRCYSIEVLYNTQDKINCILFVNGEEWEVARDIVSNPQFTSLIPENSELKLEFKKKQELKFTLGITLVND
jgi:hypothetical protein